MPSLITILLLCLCTAICSAQSVPTVPVNQLELPDKTFEINFQWQGDSIPTGWEPHAALLLPVKLPGCSRQFYMQFDLGSPYSLVYKNKINAIKTKYPGSVPSQEAGGKLQNFWFNADLVPVLAKEIIVKQFDSTGIDWKDSNSIEIIGTIGTDLIDGKVAIIDYPHCKLTISQSIPVRLMQHISLAGFIYTNRSVLLPAKIKNRETILYFDTGSSMFELLTDKETCNQLAIFNENPVQYTVKSWNKLLTANTFVSNESIEFAGTIIPLRSSTYIEGISNAQIEQMSKMGIKGMIGNKLFVNHILVLDTKGKRFGLTAPF